MEDRDLQATANRVDQSRRWPRTVSRKSFALNEPKYLSLTRSLLDRNTISIAGLGEVSLSGLVSPFNSYEPGIPLQWSIETSRDTQ